MAEHKIYIPKVSDKTLFDGFEKLAKLHSEILNPSPNAKINLIGEISISNIVFGNELPEILTRVIEKDSKVINTFTLNYPGFPITFHRGGNNNEQSTVYDGIVINVQNAGQDPEARLEAITFINDEFNAFSPEATPTGIITKEQQDLLNIQISSIQKLEKLNADLTEKITIELKEKHDELEADYKNKKKELDKLLEDDRSKLLADIEAKEEKLKTREGTLDNREQQLDLRDNTAARREDLQKLITKIQTSLSEFKLSKETTQLRWPIHIVCVALIVVASIMSYKYGREFLSILTPGTDGTLPVKDYIIWQISIKQLAFTAIVVSTVIFYLKWMNSWFNKNAKEEFHLKQLLIDLERANWAVESVLEWDQSKDGKPMPNDLLNSLTNNLFVGTSEDINPALHPSDQVMALLGNVDKMELTGKGLQKAKTAIGKMTE